jgi:hypothetical protein
LECKAEVAIPQGIEADPSIFPAADQSGVVAFALRDEMQGATDTFRFILYDACEFLEQGQGGDIGKRVDVADIQCIDVKIPEPPERAFGEVPPNLVAVWTVKVDDPVPEVGSEGDKGVPLDSRLEQGRAEHDGKTLPMAGVDEPFQSCRPAHGHGHGTGQA